MMNDNYAIDACKPSTYLRTTDTGANLAETVGVALAVWDLDAANQNCVTKENGIYIIFAAKILDWPRLSCFSHIYTLLSPKLCKMIVDVVRQLECVRCQLFP